MSKGEKAGAVFRALLKELEVNFTEVQGEGVQSFKSEEYKFTLNVHSGEDGSFDKTVLEKSSDGEEGCKKFEAVVDALTELLKAFACEEPKDEEKAKEEEAKEKEDGSEEKEGEGQTKEKPVEPAATD